MEWIMLGILAVEAAIVLPLAGYVLKKKAKRYLDERRDDETQRRGKADRV